MSITLETTMRDRLADAIDDGVNSGTGTATLVFETSGDVAVATLNLQDPPFDAAGSAGGNAAGTIALEGTPLSDTSADSTNTIAQFSVYNKSGTKQFEGTVATSGTPAITISSTGVTAGDTVQLTSFTMTVPAS